MKLEDQLVSLELAKKLKELGVKQDSLFYYRAWENPLGGIFKESDVKDDFWGIYYFNNKESLSRDFDLSAFSVAELGEILKGKHHDFVHFSGTFWNYAWKEWESLAEDQNGEEVVSQCNLKEADARAKMLIYLLEIDYVKGGIRGYL